MNTVPLATRSDLAGVAFDRDPARTEDPRRSRAALGWLALWTLLALALRFYRLDQQSFWTDEVESIKLLTKPGIDPLYVIQHNFHGPLHKALLWGWCSLFGISEVAARGLSATIGALSVPILFFAARRWIGTSAALWAGFLLAINPFHIWYSQEVRGYVLLMAMSGLTMWAFVRDLRTRSRASGLVLGLASICAALSNFGGLFVIAVVVVFGVLAGWRRGYPLPRLGLIMFIVAFALSPYFVEFGSTVDPDAIVGIGDKAADRPLRGSHTFSILAPVHSLFAYSLGITLGPAIDAMHRSLSFATFRPHLFELAASAVVFGVLGLLGLARSRVRPERFGFLLLWLIVPIAATAVLAYLNIKVYNVRYPSGGFLAWILIVALGLRHLPPPARWAAAAAVVGLSGWSITNLYTDEAYMRPDAGAAAALIAEHEQPGDRILLYSIPESFVYYYHWRGKGEIGVDLLTGGHTWNETRFLKFLSEYTDCEGRIWLVRWRSWYIDPNDACKATLDENLDHLASWEFTNLPVDLYECGDGDIPNIVR